MKWTQLLQIEGTVIVNCVIELTRCYAPVLSLEERKVHHNVTSWKALTEYTSCLRKRVLSVNPPLFSLNFDCFYIGVKVAVHCHDKNLSIAKFIREKYLEASETRDTCHGRYVVLVVYLAM